MNPRTRSPLVKACAATLAVISGSTAFAAGLNIVPPMPDPKPATGAGIEPDDFWGEFWNGPGGFTWKDFALTGTLNYKGFYTDNLQTSGASKLADFASYLTPLIQIDRSVESSTGGTGIHVAYQPTFIFNASHPEFDRNYQAVRGSVDHQWNENVMTVGHRYQKTSEGLAQSGVLAPQEVNDTLLSFRTPITGKITLELGAEQGFSTTEATPLFPKQSVDSWEGTAFATMDLLPKVSTGLGLAGGYSEQRNLTRSYQFVNERLLTRWGYLLSGKLNLNLDAGLQLAQSQTAGVRDPEVAPIYTASLTYNPRYGTSLMLQSGRSSGAAQLYSGQNILQTSVQVTVRQRLYENFALLAAAGYNLGDYEVLDRALPGAAAGYHSYNLSTEIQWRINARISSGLFYQFQNRTSARSTDALSANQVGLNLDLRF